MGHIINSHSHENDCIAHYFCQIKKEVNKMDIELLFKVKKAQQLESSSTRINPEVLSRVVLSLWKGQRDGNN